MARALAKKDSSTSSVRRTPRDGEDGTTDGPAVYRAGDNLEEASTTWRTRPQLFSSVVADAGAVAANSWVEYDVTRLVSGDGALTLALIPTSSNGMDVYSREVGDASLRPRLVVTTEPQSPDPATCMAVTERTEQVFRRVGPGHGDLEHPAGASGERARRCGQRHRQDLGRVRCERLRERQRRLWLRPHPGLDGWREVLRGRSLGGQLALGAARPHPGADLLHVPRQRRRRAHRVEAPIRHDGQ